MDNVEITEEMLDNAITCARGESIACSKCKMLNGTYGETACREHLVNEIRRLREERKNNPGVWDGAPNDATCVEVERIFYSGKSRVVLTSAYTRTLPKSRARQIAEYRARIFCAGGKSIHFQEAVSDSIEAAILEYTKETK